MKTLMLRRYNNLVVFVADTQGGTAAENEDQ